jgi:hypothetical protein
MQTINLICIYCKKKSNEFITISQATFSYKHGQEFGIPEKKKLFSVEGYKYFFQLSLFKKF